MNLRAKMSEDWKAGKHEWRTASNDCAICGTRRLDNGDFCIYRLPESVDSAARDVWERACPPCKPRTEDVPPGLHTAKEAIEILGITHSVFVNRVAVRWLRPFAVLEKPRAYLWSDRQLDAIALTDSEWNESAKVVVQ